MYDVDVKYDCKLALEEQERDTMGEGLVPGRTHKDPYSRRRRGERQGYLDLVARGRRGTWSTQIQVRIMLMCQRFLTRLDAHPQADHHLRLQNLC